jgi:peptide/nickel transport system permease protein
VSAAAAAETPRAPLPGTRVLHRLARQPTTLGALGFLVPLLVVAWNAHDLAPYHWMYIDTSRFEEPPSLAGWHVFGTDNIGRDVFSRSLWALGESERIALSAAGLATLVGTLVGALAGYFGGLLDAFLMRIGDLATAYPAVLVLLAVIVYARPVTPRTLTIVLAAYLWVAVARVVRASFVSQREQEYVEAARALGASDLRIVFRHLLPNSAGPIVVAGTTVVGQAILLDATTEFFNFGLNQEEQPTLGNMLADVTKYGVGVRSPVGYGWWMWAFPALVLVLVLVAVNLVGDGLDAALNPRR